MIQMRKYLNKKILNALLTDLYFWSWSSYKEKTTEYIRDNDFDKMLLKLLS